MTRLDGKAAGTIENFVLSTSGSGYTVLNLSGPKRYASSTSPTTQGIQLSSDPNGVTYIPSSVGIGTTQPAYNLDVDNSYIQRTTNSGLFRIRNSAGVNIMTVGDDGSIVFSGPIVAQDNFEVLGTNTVVNTSTQELNIGNNQVVMNSGVTGMPTLDAGVRVNRGLLDDYLLFFSEANDRFEIGTEGNLQPVATRESAPTSRGLPYWDAGSFLFTTTDSLLYDTNGALRLGLSTGATVVNMLDVGGNGQLRGTNLFTTGGDTATLYLGDASSNYVRGTYVASGLAHTLTANGKAGLNLSVNNSPVLALAAGTVNVPGLTASTILLADASKNIVSASTSTYPSPTELAYVKGVTSALQTQLDAKEGTVTAGTTSQYYRGDKTFQTLDQAAVAGLTTASSPSFTGVTSSGGTFTSGAATTTLATSGGTAAIINTTGASVRRLFTGATPSTPTTATLGTDTTLYVQTGNATIAAIDALLYFNGYYDGSNHRLSNTGYGGAIKVDNSTGDMQFRLFPSGTAGAVTSIPIRMSITNAGSVNIPGLTASTILVSDGSKNIASADTATYPSLTELAYVKGVTSAVQTQLNGKEGTVTAGTTAQYYRGDKTFQTLNQAAVSGLTTASSPTFDNVTLTSGGLSTTSATLSVTTASANSFVANQHGLSMLALFAGNLTPLASSEFGNSKVVSGGDFSTYQHDRSYAFNAYYDGSNWKRITSGYAARMQLTSAGALDFQIATTGAGGTTASMSAPLTLNSAGDVRLNNATASTILITDASKNAISASTSTYPSLTELAYVKGVTSAVQTQLNAKEGTVTAATTADYYRGDKTFQPLNQAAVSGLTTASSPSFTGVTSSGGTFTSGAANSTLTCSGGTASVLNQNGTSVRRLQAGSTPAAVTSTYGDSSILALTGNIVVGSPGQGLNFNNYYDGAVVRYINNGYAGSIKFDSATGDMQFRMAGTSVAEGTVVNNTRLTLTNGGSLNLASLTADRVLIADSSKNIISASTSTYPSLTELSYVKGVTSAIQTQLNGKEGTVTAGTTADYYRGDKTFQTLNQAAVDGLTTASSPTFAGVTAGNLNAASNTLSSTNSNGNINVTPNGTGNCNCSRFVFQNVTQAAKLALSSPTAGMAVFDTTSNVLSYYNGTNWYVPSVLYLDTTGQNVGDILWDTSTASADARLSIDTGTGVITVTDTGTYEVSVQIAAYLGGSSSERHIQTKFVRISGPTTLIENNFQIADTVNTGNDFSTAPLISILTLTAGQTYKFTFESLPDNNALLYTTSTGFIRRIT